MKKGWYWPWIIAALLLFTAAFQAVLVWAATHDPSMAVEPDYYRKAVAWNAQMAQDSANAALGWSARAEIGTMGGGGARVTVRLTGPDAAAVRGARVRLVAIHNLDGARHLEGALDEQPDGAYAARLPLDRPGLWELRLDAMRGAEHFTASLRADAAGGRAAAAPVAAR